MAFWLISEAKNYKLKSSFLVPLKFPFCAFCAFLRPISFMKSITRNDLRNQLKRREIAPVYVLFGAEDYLRDLAAKTIADLVFGKDGFRDFNESEFSLSVDGNLGSALAAAEQLPMMAERRVIRVTDVRVSATAAKDTLKEEHEEMLSDYLANPAPAAVVIFIADELNGVRKIGRLLREKAVAVEFERLADGELVQWARDKIHEAGSDADDRTLRHLTALTGPDLRRLTNEIGKLSTAALPEKTITFEMVDSLVPNVREIDNFQLADQLLAGNRPVVLKTLKKILDDGAEPVMLLGLLSYNFRRLLMAKEMMEQGAERSDVARVLKMRYGDQEPFLAAARRADADRLASVLKRLADVDLALKTSVGGGGPAGGRMQIEMLVCELAIQ